MIFTRIKSIDAILSTARERPLTRTLGAAQLTLLGVGAIIGTGIFVLTSEAAQKAGPAMILAFLIAGSICAVAALCYAELASMVPVSGSAYTYSYAVMGELPAWMVGWALILEYAVAASAVSVGWSGYFVGQLRGWFGISLPSWATSGPYAGGVINIPAVVLAIAITGLLMRGTRESARLNACLVAIKIAALTLFVILAVPVMRMDHFTPFAPQGWLGAGGSGIIGAAASIFFAYVGFDAVATAAEETVDPQRNIPLGLIGSLAICTIFYVLVACGAIGSPSSAQPVLDTIGHWLAPGSTALAERCTQLGGTEMAVPLPCSHEALAEVLRSIGYLKFGNLIGLAAFLALPSVVLVMIYAQTRMFFVMARDGLISERLAKVHVRWGTPHVITMITGGGVALASAFLPVGKLADISNAGTLFAFLMVAVSVMLLRRREPGRRRPFRTPALRLVGPLTVAGCIALYLALPTAAMLVLPIWGAIGLTIYLGYGRRHSHVGRGLRQEAPALHPDI